MISSDDDAVELRLKAVDNYYFVDDDDALVSFDVLPFQFNAAEEVPSFKRDVYLRGFADGGLQNVYKQVVAWKLSLDSKLPEITVLSTEGSWIVLLKPRSSYEETARSVLITLEMLHFVRRNPMVSEEEMWGHLHKVFGKYEIKPLVDDFRNHIQLIKLFAKRDPAIAQSQTLQLFINENTVEKVDDIAQNAVEMIDKADQDTVEMVDKVSKNNLENIDKVAKNTVEKINKVGSNDLDLDVKHPFIADDEEREEIVEDEHEFCKDDNEADEEEEEGDLFDSVCGICDNGGELLCCEGLCMRSFHAKIGDGEDSYCATLGYTKAELEAIKIFLCKNCEYKQHQCFVCGVLEPSSGPNAKVFLCNNATCGHFYHPRCVTQKLHPDNRNEALHLERKIVAGFSFTCPVHWCFECKGLEDRTQEPLQFAVCRRCPRSYHRKCLPREVSFEDNDEKGVITRAWELSKRILIYCLDHDMDLDIGTPSRDHLKFPRVAKTVQSVKKKVKEIAKKKRQTLDEPVQRSSKRVRKSLFGQPVSEPVKEKAKHLKEPLHSEEYLLDCYSVANSPKRPVKEQEQGLAYLSLPTAAKTPQSSFPVVDIETEKRVTNLVENEISSLTLDDISRRCVIPSTYVTSGRQIDKIIAQGKLERSVQAVQAAPQKLENGGSVDDAKAVCEVEVLRQITRWNNKLRVYLAPFIHGMRYTSFGRHFTKKEKLIENSFCFEKRDWMTVRPKELRHGSKLIMGLNPPFGMKAMLANKFIDKALSFKPKLIILIVPKETERLDQKRQPYDLIWEDTGSLSGRSFYLPGSLDVTNKQMDQWNVSPPPLYLWSRPDWAQKHRKIADDHGHTTLRVVSLSKQMDYLLDKIRRQNDAEVPCEQNDVYGEEKGCMTENTNVVVWKPGQVNGFPPEKLVEAAYEETKAASCRRASHSDFTVDLYNDKNEVSNCSRLERTADAMKADSDMSISPSDSRSSQYKSRSDSPHMTREYSFQRVVHQDNYINNPLPEPCTSNLENEPYEDYIRNVSEYGVASVEKHLAFSASNIDAGLRMHGPNFDELTGNYTAGPDSNFYNAVSGGTCGSFYRSQNLQENHTMESMGPVPKNAVAGRNVGDVKMYGVVRSEHTQVATTTAEDIRAQIRLYGGHSVDGHPQTARNPPATDIREQIRIYGRQSTHTSGYSGSSDPQSAITSSYGIPSLDLTGRSAMDRYTPHLRETYYTTGPYNVPDNTRDMTPDSQGFGSRQQYPYPYPGSSGGWSG